MADYNDKNENMGGTATMATENVQYDDSVLKKIVNTAVQQADGVLGLGSTMMEGITNIFKSGDTASTRGVSVSQKDNELEVDIKLVVEYGKNIPAIVEQAEQRIRESLLEMTGKKVDKFTVAVVDTMTREEYKEKTEAKGPFSGNEEEKKDSDK